MTTAALYYLAGFTAAGSNQTQAFKITGVAEATIAATTYSYSTFASLVTGYASYAAAVKVAMDSAGGGPWTVTFVPPTTAGALPQFTIARATTFTLTFTAATAAHMRARACLGMVGALGAGDWVVSGAVEAPPGTWTITSTITPLYSIVPAVGGRTDFSDVYEGDDTTIEVVSDGGTPYAVSRNTTELYSDWTQAMESKAATLTRSATSSVPWTWQAFMKHVRGQHPFGVYESATANTLHKLRADGASFAPERVSTDYDGLWNIPIKTRDIGVLP